MDTFTKQPKNIYVNKKEPIEVTYNTSVTIEPLAKNCTVETEEEHKANDKKDIIQTETGHQQAIVSPTKKVEDDLTLEQCQLCFDCESDAVILECGHGGICFICSLKLLCSSGVCHICRHKVEQVVRLDIHYNDPTFMKVIEGVN